MLIITELYVSLEFNSGGEIDYMLVIRNPGYRRKMCLLLQIVITQYTINITLTKKKVNDLSKSKPCHVGIQWIALTEYFQMSTHIPGLQ